MACHQYPWKSNDWTKPRNEKSHLRCSVKRIKAAKNKWLLPELSVAANWAHCVTILDLVCHELSIAISMIRVIVGLPSLSRWETSDAKVAYIVCSIDI